MTQSEINAHASALGVATGATANATPAGADSRCCGDSSGCAGGESGPVEKAYVDHHEGHGWYVWRDIGNGFEFMSADGKWCEKMKEAPCHRGGDYFQTGEDAMRFVANAAPDPVAEAADRRVEIEAARDELEAAAMACLEAASFNNARIGPVTRLAQAARRLSELRKGTT